MEPIDPNRKTVGIRQSWVVRRFPGSPGNRPVLPRVGVEFLLALHPVLLAAEMAVPVLAVGKFLVEEKFPAVEKYLVEGMSVPVVGLLAPVGGIPVAVGGTLVLGRIPAVLRGWDRQWDLDSLQFPPVGAGFVEGVCRMSGT